MFLKPSFFLRFYGKENDCSKWGEINPNLDNICSRFNNTSKCKTSNFRVSFLFRVLHMLRNVWRQNIKMTTTKLSQDPDLSFFHNICLLIKKISDQIPICLSSTWNSFGRFEGKFSCCILAIKHKSAKNGGSLNELRIRKKRRRKQGWPSIFCS